MINDNDAAREIQESWKGVITLRSKVKRAIMGAVAFGGTPAVFAADAVNNLPFIHSCSVLNEALLQLAKEGKFKCESIFLGKLVENSENALPWQDLDTMVELVARRNDVAHRGAILPRVECWRYIDAIEAELTAWNVL